MALKKIFLIDDDQTFLSQLVPHLENSYAITSNFTDQDLENLSLFKDSEIIILSYRLVIGKNRKLIKNILDTYTNKRFILLINQIFDKQQIIDLFKTTTFESIIKKPANSEINSEFINELLDAIKLKNYTPPKIKNAKISTKPDCIAIGSSTGGPQALISFFQELSLIKEVPFFVTQHMPESFTSVLANQISKTTGLDCKEATDGEVVKNGTVYIAPGNKHMLIKKTNISNEMYIKLSDTPAENFCKPSVDPMIRSLIENKLKFITVILTGMGKDGHQSSILAHKNGNKIIAQNEESSVVWGMPGAVTREGIVSFSGTPSQLGLHVYNSIKGLIR